MNKSMLASRVFQVVTSTGSLAQEFDEQSPISLGTGDLKGPEAISYIAFLLLAVAMCVVIVLFYLIYAKFKKNVQGESSSMIQVLSKKDLDDKVSVYVVKIKDRGYVLAGGSSGVVKVDDIQDADLLNEIQISDTRYNSGQFMSVFQKETLRLKALKKRGRE